MRQNIIDFLSGLSKSIIQGFIEHGGIGNSIEEGIEKFKKNLFIIGVAISLAATGFFLTLWGIASVIDAMFTMQGFGFVLIGLIGMLTGALVYKK
ncbi:MAG: hypothetical protein OIN86_06615 [Candidatus Methanoperedens sp.]|nr:hypothetical protein [Candidatus Methanoperedens sp.]CAG0955759.1 hypothetical protein METP1_00438 [Methanosarcinales archaeon]